MGMIHAYQKGDLKDASPSVKKAAKNIDPDDAEHFARTKHKGLPEKVKKKKKKKTNEEKVISFTEFLNEETLLTLRAKVNVPEEDIQETIEAVKNWLEKNPNRKSLTAGIFGHRAWEINKDSIEEDVRAAASQAYPYSKK